MDDKLLVNRELYNAVLRIQIRPDPTLFRIKDPDLAPDTDPPIFRTKLMNNFFKCADK